MGSPATISIKVEKPSIWYVLWFSYCLINLDKFSRTMSSMFKTAPGIPSFSCAIAKVSRKIASGKLKKRFRLAKAYRAVVYFYIVIPFYSAILERSLNLSTM